MCDYLSAEAARLAPYTPGEQPQDQQYIKLNTNESPFPPSPRVVKALSRAELLKLNLYSDPTCAALVDALARRYELKAENIITGNGSDEILAFAFRAFCGEGRPVAYADITYASSSLVLRSVTSSDTARVQGGTLRMGEPFDGLAEALPLSGYTVPDAAAYLTRPTLDLLTGYDWTPTEASGTIYYTELHFAADGTGTFGLGSDGSGTQSTYPFTFEMSDLPYAARVRLLSEGDVVFSTGSGTTLTSQSPQPDCALLFTTDGMQLAVIRLFSDGCTMLSPTAK